ncbi:MAG: TonB-dependent receptor [Bacteroidia bacterium]|nr:TonB-dependent receptor [Bacteroidia bacterium]
MTVAFKMALCAMALLASYAGTADAQSLRISGTVLDENSRRPIADVNISYGEDRGASTDAAGRFTLTIPDAGRAGAVRFRHIAYEPREIDATQLHGTVTILLQPRIIPLQSAEISGRRPEGIAAREMQISVKAIEADAFDGRGYLDVGDLLHAEHVLQVDEEFSGRKTLSMRGGNPDDVIVLFNGMKLNENSDNMFDLSMIDLADIERVELIKGSNTTLYGPDAFSGVINIVPADERPYTVRVQQQIGSYDAGIWSGQLYRRFGAWNAGYSVRNGASSRFYADVADAALRNSFIAHAAHIGWTLPGANAQTAGKFLLNFRYADNDYSNERDEENLDQRSIIAVGQYSGSVFGSEGFLLSAGWSGLRRDVALGTATNTLSRATDDGTVQARLEKTWGIGSADILISYQFSGGELDAEETASTILRQPVGFSRYSIQRQQHSFVGIGKLRGETGSSFLRHFHFDVALRHDMLNDRLSNSELRAGSSGAVLPTFGDWSHSLFKFAVGVSGMRDDILLDIFLSYGNNVKFPTLAQLVSVPALIDPTLSVDRLEAETNRSVELGASLTRTFSGRLISGWELNGGVFQNSYTNKLRSISTPGLPFDLYDNVDDASITGLEASAGVYFAGKVVLAEVGVSRYFISDLAAFPFRSESKQTISVSANYSGHSLRILAFHEGEQIGILRLPDGSFAETVLPAFRNLDVHVASSFSLGGLGAFITVSLRNLLNDSSVLLSGLALRDRRYYVTIGARY